MKTGIINHKVENEKPPRLQSRFQGLTSPIDESVYQSVVDM